jgi:hypothetical protein
VPWFGGAGGGYSGAKWVAEESLFLTLLRRPPESDDATDADSCWSDEFEPSEKSDESLWLDRFLSDSMVEGG